METNTFLIALIGAFAIWLALTDRLPNIVNAGRVLVARPNATVTIQ